MTGRAEEVSDADDIERMRTLPLRSWAGEKAAFIRLQPTQITGRSLA